MKVLLIEPPYTSIIEQFLGVHGPLLGFGYIANQLEQDGHDVEILDCPTLRISLNELKLLVAKFNPDVVGITATTPSYRQALKVAEAIKKWNQNCKIVIGGPHVSFEDYSALTNSFVDVVVRGEGEATMRELVNNLQGDLKKVSGITFREGGIVRRNPDRQLIANLDTLSVSYHKLPMDRYLFQGKRYATIISSRGCPFGCIFCSSSLLHGKMWRWQSPERVLREIQMLRSKYGVRNIEFLDDLFTFNMKRVYELCNLMIKERLDIKWFCSSRVDTINRDLIRIMRKAGCIGIYFGVESGCQRILNILRKGIRLEQAVKAIANSKAEGIETVATFIIGVPGETVEEIRQTIAFARKLRADYSQFTYCTPYPGTPLYRFAKDNNLLLTLNWDRYTTMEQVMRVPNITEKEMRKLFRDAYLGCLPAYLWKVVKKKKFGLIKNIFIGTAKAMLD
jgi:radical SAM superfamily enzyme YgiQ (UPF0313 family)